MNVKNGNPRRHFEERNDNRNIARIQSCVNKINVD